LALQNTLQFYSLVSY